MISWALCNLREDSLNLRCGTACLFSVGRAIDSASEEDRQLNFYMYGCACGRCSLGMNSDVRR